MTAEMKEIFALQDRIALETLKALDVKLIRGEQGSPCWKDHGQPGGL